MLVGLVQTFTCHLEIFLCHQDDEISLSDIECDIPYCLFLVRLGSFQVGLTLADGVVDLVEIEQRDAGTEVVGLVSEILAIETIGGWVDLSAKALVKGCSCIETGEAACTGSISACPISLDGNISLLDQDVVGYSLPDTSIQ